ncbi:hypothetical protein EV363DRAFT_1301438 [Boletus edulis]|nr:hypothetical protein EV363DRAFT_1301438 [Boletus edulis]
MPVVRAARSPSPLPALPIVPIVPEIPPIDAIYHPCIVVQRTSTNLIIYTRDLGCMITVAYPLGPFGAHIVPSGIFDWMKRRGLVFECFCALVSSQPTPARFVNEFLSEHTVVRCHYGDNHCGFYLDITKTCLTTLFESSYKYLPTLAFGVPRIPAILARWRRLVAQDVMLLQHPAPFVQGYFSIHTSIYQGIFQLRSSLSRPVVRAASHRRASYHPYQHASQSARRKTIERYSSPAVESGPSNQFSERETDTLEDLKMGLGCDHCGQSFMRSALRVHIRQIEETKQYMSRVVTIDTKLKYDVLVAVATVTELMEMKTLKSYDRWIWPDKGESGPCGGKMKDK